MKTIVVISGKGGTGKTVLTASFAVLAKRKVMVDCDVDAADLYLLLHPVVRERHEFRSGRRAVIDGDRCKRCGLCIEVCRFDAIKEDFRVEDFSCEGCGLCSRVCPYGAICMEEEVAGEWFISDTTRGPMVHARLGVAQENSGKLVSQVRQAAKGLAEEQGLEYVIIDGPPGIGCPVIASLSGADCALVVTEPTLSGLHDASRVMEVAGHFHVPVKLAVNKFDLNPRLTEEIEGFCRTRGVPVLARIPFDRNVVESVVRGQTVMENTNSEPARQIQKIWDDLK